MNQDLPGFVVLLSGGIDAHAFSFPYQGLDNRLIGPAGEGEVVKGILA